MGIIAGMDASSRPPGAVSNRLAGWFATPLGRYLLQREQAQFDRTVADIFGFHAIQIGLPDCPFLAQSRITTCWTVDPEPPAQLLADPQWLPFPENSLDLIVLPHALEFAPDPHALLREVYRTVRPDGQVVICGFNPFSLFGAKRYFGRAQTPPWNGNFIALYRLKDWLALLGFDVTGGSLDCYVPPFCAGEMAAPLRLLRACGRPVVADRGRRVFSAGDQEDPRHARHHPCVGAAHERPCDRAAAGARMHRVSAPGRPKREWALQAAALRDATPPRAVHAGAGRHGAAALGPLGGRRAAPRGHSDEPLMTGTVIIHTRRRMQGQSRPRRLGCAAGLGRSREGIVRRRAAHDEQPDGADRRHPGARKPEARLRRRDLHRLAVRQERASKAGSMAGRGMAGRPATASR